MSRAFAILILCAAPVMAETVAVPSGQPVTFVDVIEDAEGTHERTLRFRFLAPEIARETGTIGIDAALDDIDALCREFVLPRLAEAGDTPDQVIISLSDRPVEFGVASPEATQFFEAYSVENDACVWEGY